jgi:uncharacterized protein (TIGR02466 family)
MIANLWYTPVAVVDLKPHFKNFEAATELMLAVWPKPNPFNKFELWHTPEFSELYSAIHFEVKKFTSEVFLEDELVFTDGYFNQYFSGEKNTPHHHAYAKAIAVYNVDAPPDSGDLLLHDPRGAVDWENITEESSRGRVADRAFVRINPVPGSLVICPAYLIHSVETNLSKEDRPRITIGIDLFSKKLVDRFSTL